MLIKILNQLGGVNSSVSQLLAPQNSAMVLNGVLIDYKLGAIIKDVGYSRVSTQIEADKSILGLFNFVQIPSVQKMLATCNDATDDDTQLFYKTAAGAWTEITAAETAWANVADAKVEMANFIGYCFFVGYSETDGFLPVASLTGTTFSTSDNVTSMPQGKYVVPYRDKLYVFNTKVGGTETPYRIHSSDAVSGGAISWSGDFLDVGYNEELTGGFEFMDKLYGFTHESTWVYDGSTWKKRWSMGAFHRTVRDDGQYLFGANRNGVWMSIGGQYPTYISGKVVGFFRGGSPQDFFAEIVDENYILYVGTVTVNGITYANTELVFNIPTQTWRWRENASNMTSFARFRDPSTGSVRRYMGDDSGNVWDKAKHTDATLISSDEYVNAGDTGKAILGHFELAPLFFDEPSITKDVFELYAYAERAGSVKLSIVSIDKNARVLQEVTPAMELKDFVNKVDIRPKDAPLVQIVGSEHSKHPYFSILGFALNVEKASNIIT